jgi:hypothetical protein
MKTYLLVIEFRAVATTRAAQWVDARKHFEQTHPQYFNGSIRADVFEDADA